MSIPNLAAVSQLLSLATGLLSTNNVSAIPIINQLFPVITQLLSGASGPSVVSTLSGLLPLLSASFPQLAPLLIVIINLLSLPGGLPASLRV